MKKIIIAIVLTLLISLTIGGMIFIKNTKDKKTEELDKHLITLAPAEFKEKIENKDSFILIITGSNCSHCEGYKPTFKPSVLMPIILVRVVCGLFDTIATFWPNILLSNEDLAYLKNIATTSGTPTVVFINKGEETSTYNRIVGNVSKAKTTERLKSLGYIK